MGKITISPDDLVQEIGETEGITLLTGTAYTQGMVVVLQDTGKYENEIILNPEDTPAGTELPYSEQKVYILAADVDATGGDAEGVGYTGTFNANKVTFGSTQVVADVAGTLQAKNIILNDWRL
ncbi:MAG: hypothetical protein ACTSO3_16630 [Candidatus Heimdallarchaeaceae archaeon]